MALVNRISRLFKADFHAVLDRIEEPEQLLKQSIRDMEDELAAVQQRLRNAAQEQEGIGTRKCELETKLTRIEEELDLCFASKKHDLARSLVRKKLEGQRFLKGLETRFAQNLLYLEKARTQLDADNATLEGLKQKSEIIAQRIPGGGEVVAGDVAWTSRDLTVSDDEIEVAFLREQQARSAS